MFPAKEKVYIEETEELFLEIVFGFSGFVLKLSIVNCVHILKIFPS